MLSLQSMVLEKGDGGKEMKQREYKEYYKGFKPQYSNFWFFPTNDPRYGTKKYRGRCAGQTIKNLLWLYTNEGDIVLDPFAGGGTTPDVCNEWKRQCYASDIRPCRTDIARRDVITDGLMDVRSKLIILDPPYGTMLKGKYTDEPTDLGNMTIDGFYDAMKQVGSACLDRLVPNGRIALFCGIIKKSKSVCIDLTFTLVKIFEELGYVVEERIVERQSRHSSHTGYWIAGARNNGFLLRCYKDIIIFVRRGHNFKDEKFDKKWQRGADVMEWLK